MGATLIEYIAVWFYFFTMGAPRGLCVWALFEREGIFSDKRITFGNRVD